MRNLNINSTSGAQLSRLLSQLGVHDAEIVSKKNIPYSRADNLIINLDDGPGTHWVAMCRSKKKYFDSYGQPQPEEVPQSFKHRKTIIEGIHDSDCGQLCALWLHYLHNKGEPSFYSLFDKLYT